MKDDRGLTLVEILVVTAVLAILISLVVIAIFPQADTARIAGAKKQFNQLNDVYGECFLSSPREVVSCFTESISEGDVLENMRATLDDLYICDTVKEASGGRRGIVLLAFDREGSGKNEGHVPCTDVEDEDYTDFFCLDYTRTKVSTDIFEGSGSLNDIIQAVECP